MSIEGWGKAPPSTPLTSWKSLKANLDLWLVDHGFLRSLYSYRFCLPGPLYRSNQPSVARIHRYKRDLGPKTIINLRVTTQPNDISWKRKLVKKLVSRSSMPVFTRGLPTAKQINSLKELIEEFETPALVHCKSGPIASEYLRYSIVTSNRPVDRRGKETTSLDIWSFQKAKTGISITFSSRISDTEIGTPHPRRTRQLQLSWNGSTQSMIGISWKKSLHHEVSRAFGLTGS